MTRPQDVLIPEKAEKYVRRPLTETPFLIFEGINASDTAWMDAILALRQELVKIPVDELHHGAYTGQGVTDGFLRLGSIPGIGMQRGGVAPYDAWSQYGGEKIPEVAVKVLRNLLDLCIPDKIRIAPITINKYSSIGLPTLAKDATTKVREAYAWADRAERRLAMMASGSLKELYDTDGIVFCGTNGERFQYPKIKWEDGRYQIKRREVRTYDGEWEEVDWTAPEPWASYDPLFHRCRRRVINVTPMSAFPLRILHATIFKHMKNVASFTWEHKGNVALGRKAARFPADEFLDATNHDWHISPVFLYEFAHAIGRKLGWAWAGHFLMTLRQAQLIKPDKLGEGGAKLEGDPFDLKTFRAYYGNPSGIPLTSVIAYLAGTWYGLSALVLAGHLKSDKRSLQALLNGTHPTWALLNAGDNLAVLGPSDSAVTELADLITFAELGTTDSFLGSLPIRRNGEIRFVPNITSYVNNLLMPGRSLSDPQRGDPVVGAAARRQIFSAAPAFEQVDAILQKVLKTTTGIDYAALQDAGETRVRSMNFVRAMLDYNRDAFHFKLDPLDVPADILEDYFILIPEEVSRDIAQHYDRAHEGRWQRLFSDITEDYGVHHVHN